MIHVSKLRKVYRSQGWVNVVLDDVSFQLRPGQKLALIGKNGAGKSTLIRLLGKVELPTSGLVEHRMSVSWPLGFGGAFQGSLTGIDNMRFISRIYGIDHEEMRAFVEDFSELGQFLYQPVKTYSAGMRARLAFALSLTIEFECYLIDEVILVGDQRFHARCQEHLFSRRSDRALVLASHDARFVQEVCDSGLVLSGGRAYYFDDVREAMQAYQEFESRLKSDPNRSAIPPHQAAEDNEVQSCGLSLTPGAVSHGETCPPRSEGASPENQQDLCVSTNGTTSDAEVSPDDGTSPEQVVESLYRHILGRSPDPLGFAVQVRRLRENDFHKELPYLIRDFVNSEEAQARLTLLNQT